ncbi:queuine tRNA-ribosyltransferase [Trichinella spiralis]|uniref:queuine tRNA-ribosyltransferase n=1 Tax=Trichinella spiralis TaxID=6334 RepID=UPI0001EFE364|nr:queuine tRNA-ribosyltransferase [Trichinella spiralis]
MSQIQGNRTTQRVRNGTFKTLTDEALTFKLNTGSAMQRFIGNRTVVLEKWASNVGASLISINRQVSHFLQDIKRTMQPGRTGIKLFALIIDSVMQRPKGNWPVVEE